MVTCPRCGEENAERARFCSGCGFALAHADGIAREGEELRVVTALFVDIAGFTSRAETLEPEDVAALLRPYYTRVRAELERFGGRVEKFIGDAVMALFGAPVAHEDDAERAVRAAFGVRDGIAELNAADLSLGLRVRIGVNTGEALVSLGARPGETLAAGDTINTASRLQGAAPLDGILVGEQTYRATSLVVDYGPERSLMVRGKAAPVSVRDALAPRPRRAFDLARRGFAPLVGRAHELAALLETVTRALDGSEPGLAVVTGAPGLGKSRLLWELFHSLDDLGRSILWRQGRSLPYGEGVTYWAFAEIVKTQAAILEDDSAEVAKRKLARSVGGLLSDRDEAAWVEGRLRPLIGLGAPELLGEDRRQEAFSAWRRWVEQLARLRPLVLAFEDLQWADDGLLDFVDHLVEWVSGVPLAIVCTARPELLERRPSFGRRSRLDLEALSAEDTESLLESVLSSALPVELGRRLVARAGGNPLYAEEFARMLADRGLPVGAAESLPLPETVQSIIAARLDQLGPDERMALQAAAVAGKGFWPGVLARICGTETSDVLPLLERLERKQFIRLQARSAIETEPQYVFWHALVRDVAYGQIPRARRAEQHRLTAEWIAGVAGDRSEDLAELLAQHYLRAIEYARAYGQDAHGLEERGRVALREAGDRALTLYAFPAAVRFYRAACELWPEEDPDRPILLLRYGTALAWAEEGGAEILREAREALLQAGNVEAAAEADVLRSRLDLVRGERASAEEHARSAVALLENAGVSSAKANALANLCGFRMFAHDAAEAVAVGSEALRMAEELGLDEVRAHVLTSVGIARSMTGEEGAAADLEQAIELAGRISSPEVVRAYAHLGSFLANQGKLARASGFYARGRRAAERFGDARGLRWLTAELLYERYWNGEWDAAVAQADELLGEIEAGAPQYSEFDARLVRGWIGLARGNPAAREDLEAGLRFARAGNDPQALFPGLAARAFAHLAEGDEAAAARLAEEALERWRASPFELPSFWTADLAVVLHALGRPEGLVDAAAGGRMTAWLEAATMFAEGSFGNAAGLYSAIGSRPDEARARLHAARAGADAELEPAQAFYRSVGAEALLALGAPRG
jgi:class 3 adenylate cyclase